MSIEKKRILLVALSGIGNYIMQSPTIAAIKKAHPQWHSTVWVAPRGTKALAEADPHVDEVIEMPIKGSLTQHWQGIQALRKHSFDIGLVFSPGQQIKSDIYLFAAGIPVRVGHTYPTHLWKNGSLFLTHKVTEHPQLHDIEQNLILAELLGVSISEYVHKPYHIELPEHLSQQGKNIRTKLSIPSDVPLVAIHAGSAPNFEWKRWPLDNFAAVARTLQEKWKAHILICGGPDEAHQKEALAQKIHQNHSIISESLLTTAAYLQNATCMISNDSGLMHLAAAVGTPTLGIFGPTSEQHTGPRGIQSFVIRGQDTTPVYNTELASSFGNTPHTTLQKVTPEMVLKEIELKQLISQ